jgi:hypothetical protein
MCSADLSDTYTVQVCLVALARDRFPTAAERRTEILRQLESARENRRR